MFPLLKLENNNFSVVITAIEFDNNIFARSTMAIFHQDITVHYNLIYNEALLPLLKLSTRPCFKYCGSPVKIGNGFVFIYFKCVWS